jgi:hypothetical protein
MDLTLNRESNGSPHEPVIEENMSQYQDKANNSDNALLVTALCLQLSHLTNDLKKHLLIQERKFF